MTDSVRPHRRQPTRLPRPWDSPGKNTGVGCHFLLQCMKVKSEREVAQSCPTLLDPMDCSLPGSSVGFSRQEYWSGVPLPSPRNYPIALLFPFLSSLTRTWGVKHFANTSGGDFWVRQMPGGQWMGCMCEGTCCGDGRPWGTGRVLSLRKERSRTPRTICQKGVEGDEQDPFILTGITWPW